MEMANDIYSNLKKTFKARERADDYFHVSDLPHICPRAVYYAKKYKVSFRKKSILLPHNVLAFAYGIAIQKFLSRYSSHLISKWICLRCGKKYYLSFDDWKYVSCNPDYLILRDYGIELNSKTLRLVGNIDALYRENGRVYIAEIKSISARQFETLNEPLFDHALQVLTYLWMFNRKKKKIDEGLERFKIERNRAVVIYFKKDFQNLEIKKFFLNRNEYRIEERLKILLKSLIEPNENSPRVCNSSLSPQAKQCKFRKICFE